MTSFAGSFKGRVSGVKANHARGHLRHMTRRRMREQGKKPPHHRPLRAKKDGKPRKVVPQHFAPDVSCAPRAPQSPAVHEAMLRALRAFSRNSYAGQNGRGHHG